MPVPVGRWGSKYFIRFSSIEITSFKRARSRYRKTLFNNYTIYRHRWNGRLLHARYSLRDTSIHIKTHSSEKSLLPRIVSLLVQLNAWYISTCTVPRCCLISALPAARFGWPWKSCWNRGPAPLSGRPVSRTASAICSQEGGDPFPSAVNPLRGA